MNSLARFYMILLSFTFAGSLMAQEKPASPPQANPNQGFLGGRFAPINEEVAAEMDIEVQDGLVAIEIIPESPAEKAGILVKDILKKIDGQAADDVDAFRALMRATKPGQTIKLLILRDKEEKEIPVTLGVRPPGFGTTQPATRP